ncbi:hypothetical protein CEUSTIGMA_g139.t1 [Chlamydomonas eustigma]|uniref:Sperm-tail PG-rich repeat-containing protein 2 n=1 Tax=Chlamydomonas eustigma TaxID=1157962 RepID=A0A250WPD6_9CHLO|nr:hypothetical protein CEUSTIGMA_g139.t1 [Chlamydomonas eustigma]|eukprot:GAX72683.1 hypothetical protein CEUSTIGMA_g139.t1 [Chlamydomonas eustigma]
MARRDYLHLPELPSAKAKDRRQLVGIIPGGSISGLAVKEYGTVVPLGADGSYMVYERLDYAEAKRRAPDAAAAMKRMRSFSGLEDTTQSVEGVVNIQDLSERQSSMASSARGPAFTMGSRTRAVLHGQSLVIPGSEMLPGPGTYDPQQPAISTGPAFTLRGKSREKPIEVLPGPGAYSGDALTKGSRDGPAFSMYSKPAPHIEDLPGPGEYNINRDISTGPAATMMSRPRPAAVEVLPGPTDYQRSQPLGKDKPAYTIQGRHESKTRTISGPAPGEYEIPEMWKSGVAFTLGGRHLEPEVEDLPGPGAYHSVYRSSVGSPSAPAYTMGAALPDKPGSDSPGPGEYYRDLKQTAPAFTIRPKTQTTASLTTDVPGPGSYHANTQRPNSPSAPAYTMRPRTQPLGGATREGVEQVPGPGAYEALGPETGPAFTMSARQPTGMAPDSPGPADYNMESYAETGPAFTMGMRPQERVDQGLPAPGEYEMPRESWRQGPAYTMRLQLLDTLAARPESPGPGQYTVRALEGGPAFTMSGRVADPSASSSAALPGPGEYEYERLDGGPAFSMRGKEGQRAATQSPGPGDYFKASKAGMEAPAFTMRSKTLDLSAEDGSPAGPGQYNPEKLLPAAPAYTMRPKTEAESVPESPGPGTYTEVHLAQGPAWTMKGPHRPPADAHEPGQDSPGPTHYNAPQSTLDGPAFTMRGRVKDAEEEGHPGPGEYVGAGQARGGPAYTIRSRPTEASPPPSPGPGDYNDSRVLRGPAFTMKGRHQELDVVGEDVFIDPDIPGPGIYGNPNVPGKDQIGLSGPAYTMRPKLEIKESPRAPGPGEYSSIATSPEGPSYTMGSRQPVKRQSALQQDSPAPGHYGSPGPSIGTEGPAFSLLGKISLPANANAEAGPAPGDYGAPQKVGPDGPAFSLGGKRKDKGPGHKALEPGPGQHQTLASEQNGPAFTMGRKLKKGRRNVKAPDPGQYHQSLGPSGPAHSFPASSRGSGPGARADARDTPGPADHAELAGPPGGGAAWTLGARPQPPSPNGNPGPGQYNDARSFSRPLGTVVSSFMGGPRVEYIATSFGYADLYGQHGPSNSPRRMRRVTFESSTMFRDSMEMRDTTNGLIRAAENVKRLPGQAAAAGRRASSAPRKSTAVAAAGRSAGNGAGHKRSSVNQARIGVAAAAEDAARLLARMKIRDVTSFEGYGGRRVGASKAPVPKLEVPSSGYGAENVMSCRDQSVVRRGAPVRYQTHIGVGGGLYTFELVGGGTGGKGETGAVSKPKATPWGIPGNVGEGRRRQEGGAAGAAQMRAAAAGPGVQPNTGGGSSKLVIGKNQPASSQSKGARRSLLYGSVEFGRDQRLPSSVSGRGYAHKVSVV